MKQVSAQAFNSLKLITCSQVYDDVIVEKKETNIKWLKDGSIVSAKHHDAAFIDLRKLGSGLCLTMVEKTLTMAKRKGLNPVKVSYSILLYTLSNAHICSNLDIICSTFVIL